MVRKPTYEELEQRIKELEKTAIERKLQEERLESYQFMVETAYDAVFFKDLKSRYVVANSKTLEAFGLSRQEVIGKNDYEIMPNKEEAKKNIEDDQIVFKTGKRKELTKHMTGVDGKEHWFQAIKVPQFDDKGNIIGLVGIARDITRRKQTEEALRESEMRSRSVFESATEPIHLLDAQGTILKTNPATISLLGYLEEELVGRCLAEFFTPASQRIFEEQFPVLVEKGVNRQEVELVSKDGKIITVDCSASAIRDERGSVTSFVALQRDITEQKRADEEKNKLRSQLQQAQKLEAIASLAGGIAHQFNNALVGIYGNIELLQMDLPDNETINKYVKRMKDSTHRMANLTNQLLAHARGGKYQPKTISLNDLVRYTVPSIEQSIDPTIRVETDLPGNISHVEADLPQMEMVLSAVLHNAAEAMEGEGRIRIITKNENIDEEFVRTTTYVKPGPYVCVKIEDEGKGMDKETRSKVFEPFFSTKFQGRGLGMAAVYGIVKNHGGWISVDSELGKGTVVRIYLPAVEVQVEQAKETKAEVSTGTGTILVIKDEDVVIDVIRPMLERLGYRVLLAKTGTEAVEVAKTFDGDIDLAILDVVLPDMEGKEVYPLIMEARPNLKVIVCSGYTIDGPGQEILDAGAQDFIQKPFSLETLLEKLKETIGTSMI